MVFVKTSRRQAKNLIDIVIIEHKRYTHRQKYFSFWESIYNNNSNEKLFETSMILLNRLVVVYVGMDLLNTLTYISVLPDKQ